jgi:hypothetical protein
MDTGSGAEIQIRSLVSMVAADECLFSVLSTGASQWRLCWIDSTS